MNWIEKLYNAIVGVQTDTTDIKTNTDLIPDLISGPITYWSDTQLGLTIPAVAGTLAMPSVVVSGLPVGATVISAKAILIYRILDNLNAGANKLDGATVAATSQVVQIKKGGGAWVDAITFLDDQFSIAGSTREGGAPVACAIDLSTTITGNDTYSFQWLLAKADLASLYMQGVHMLIQVAYTI